jgi:hypothetical protein
MKNFSFVNSKASKRKYYQLLIDSFIKGKDKQYSQEITHIKKLFEKNELNNFIELDKYISNLVYEVLTKSTTTQSSSNYMNSSINGESSIINLAFKTSILNDDDNKQNNRLQTSFEEIAIDKNTDLISNAQENISENSNINNRKKILKLKIY